MIEHRAIYENIIVFTPLEYFDDIRNRPTKHVHHGCRLFQIRSQTSDLLYICVSFILIYRKLFRVECGLISYLLTDLQYDYPKYFIQGALYRQSNITPWTRLTMAYDVTTQRYRKSHAKIKVSKRDILRCMGSKFCVKFQRCTLKLHNILDP